jgi:hypothetical protein
MLLCGGPETDKLTGEQTENKQTNELTCTCNFRSGIS